MRYKNFDDFLQDKCPCHTNNSDEGYEKWIEDMDKQQLIDFMYEYEKLLSAQYDEKIQNVTSQIKQLTEFVKGLHI